MAVPYMIHLSCIFENLTIVFGIFSMYVDCGEKSKFHFCRSPDKWGYSSHNSKNEGMRRFCVPPYSPRVTPLHRRRPRTVDTAINCLNYSNMLDIVSSTEVRNSS